MGKSRMMGAGNASSTLYKCSPNLPSGGGNKKQGITSRVGLNNWENREVQTQSNGIGRFKFHFMNQLGGVEPGHSMFGGRWNRGHGLSIQFEQKQLEVKIKQDENNGVIIPLEKRLVRSTRVRSTSCDYKLTLVNENETEFKFSISPNCGINTLKTIFGYVWFNNELCQSCKNEGSIYATDEYEFIIKKRDYEGTIISNVKIDFFSDDPNSDFDADYTLLGTFKWDRYETV